MGTRPARAAATTLAVVALAVELGYLGWRVGTTAPSPLGVLLLVLELYGAVAFGLFVFSVWDQRPPPLPEGPVDPASLRVAVLITTYNEDENILLPTVAAAVALRPAHETWVLDDGDRAWVREMSEALGVRYVARPTHEHAKAGNLNHALALVKADVVAVLDADHVPSPSFLERTLPWFADPAVGLVQTPQEFYNDGSFEHVGPVHDETLFYRVIQPGKNRWDAAFWCGTSALLRTAALRDVGGVATESVTEDYLTTIRLCAAGWRTVFHDEVLCRGLAPTSYREYLSQRRRWATGAMQVLRSGDNPLVAPGLRLRQRLAFAASATGWFDGVRSVALLLVALAVAVTGTSPIRADPWVFAGATVGTMVVTQAAMIALTRHVYRALPSIVFDALRIPVALTAVRRLLVPGDVEFGVTGKGRTGSRRAPLRVPWSIAVATATAFAGWVLVLGRNLGLLGGPTGAHVTVAGVVLLVEWAVLLTAVERIRHPDFAPDRRRAFRFERLLPMRIADGWAGSAGISTSGGRVDRVLAATASRSGGVVTPTASRSGGAVPPASSTQGGVIPAGSYEVLVGTDEGWVRLVADALPGEGGETSLAFQPGQWLGRAALARTLFSPARRHGPPLLGHGYGSRDGRVLETSP